MDMALFQELAASLKSASDLVKGLKDLIPGRQAAKASQSVERLNEAVVAAYGAALAAQMAQSALIQRVRECEEECERLKTWGETKARYRLVSPWPGAFVYALTRPTMEPSEPAHWICASCYEQGRKSILQQISTVPGHDLMYLLRCPACESGLSHHEPADMVPEYA